jgi:5-methylcytosine-specific restriction endonuclease McrBC GTP-binding regulatory subunit McrB
MKNFITSLFILITILSCDNSMTTKTLKKEAEACMKGAMDEANKWLKILDEIGYRALDDQKYPPPFNEIMIDTMNKNEIQRRIRWMEHEFGKVESRDFFGAHVIFKGKLLTYVPDKMKRFKQISPKKLGLNDISDLYKNKIEGTYVLLMYESKPTEKEDAEELIVMWLDKNNKWSFIDYYIDKEI